MSSFTIRRKKSLSGAVKPDIKQDLFEQSQTLALKKLVTFPSVLVPNPYLLLKKLKPAHIKTYSLPPMELKA